jgi:hypothetical protein
MAGLRIGALVQEQLRLMWVFLDYILHFNDFEPFRRMPFLYRGWKVLSQGLSLLVIHVYG